MDWHPVLTSATIVKDSSDMVETKATIMTNPDGSSGLGIPAYKPETVTSDNEINEVRQRFVRNNLEILLAFREALSDSNLPRTIEDMRLITPEAQVSKWDRNNVAILIVLDTLYFLTHLILSFVGVTRAAIFTDMFAGNNDDETTVSKSSTSRIAFFVAIIISQIIICFGGIYATRVKNVYGMNVYLLCQVILTIIFIRGASWVLLIVRPITMIGVLRYRAIALRCETILRRRFNSLDEQLVQRRRLAAQIDTLLNTVFANDPSAIESVRRAPPTAAAPRANSNRSTLPARSLNGSFTTLIANFNLEANETLQQRHRSPANAGEQMARPDVASNAPFTIVSASEPGQQDSNSRRSSQVASRPEASISWVAFYSGTSSSASSSSASSTESDTESDPSSNTGSRVSTTESDTHIHYAPAATSPSAAAAAATETRPQTPVPGVFSRPGSAAHPEHGLSTASARLVTSAVSTLQRLMSNAQLADTTRNSGSSNRVGPSVTHTIASATGLREDTTTSRTSSMATSTQATEFTHAPTRSVSYTDASAITADDLVLSATFVTSATNSGTNTTTNAIAAHHSRPLSRTAAATASSTSDDGQMPTIASLSDAASSFFQRAIHLSRRTIDYIAEELAFPARHSSEQSHRTHSNRSVAPEATNSTLNTPVITTPSIATPNIAIDALPAASPTAVPPPVQVQKQKQSDAASAFSSRHCSRRSSLELTVLPREPKSASLGQPVAAARISPYNGNKSDECAIEMHEIGRSLSESSATVSTTVSPTFPSSSSSAVSPIPSAAQSIPQVPTTTVSVSDASGLAGQASPQERSDRVALNFNSANPSSRFQREGGNGSGVWTGNQDSTNAALLPGTSER